MSFVLDASVTAAWAFHDENSFETEAILDRLAEESAYVPALWLWEVANALSLGIKRKRISGADAENFLFRLKAFSIIVEAVDTECIFQDVFSVARKHALTVYDAAYLELAMRRRLPLATQDKTLHKAAKAERVKCLL